MNALLRKALAILAIMMMAGITYLAFSSHGSHLTLPALSIDAYTTEIGTQCHYGDFVKRQYVAFQVTGGPRYIWKNNSGTVLIIQGGDSILLNTLTGQAKRWSKDQTFLDRAVAQSYAKEWYIHQLAAIGNYAHLMTPATKTFIPSMGNVQLRVAYSGTDMYGGSESIWTINKEFLPVSCTMIQGNDSLQVTWRSWQWTSDSLRVPSVARVNQTEINFTDWHAVNHIAELGLATKRDF